MNDYLSKPVNPQALAEVLERWLPKEDRGPGTEEDGRSETEGRRSLSNLSVPGLPSFVELPVFDKDALMQRLMGDDELASLVIAGFLEDIPLQIQALKGYLQAGDAHGAERQAHTIKGASANIGGEALLVVAFEMEKLGKSGDLSDVRERMDELELQFARLRDVLEKEI
jgi:HPt (histidine-containing phosphotransfer) domain-containing protein